MTDAEGVERRRPDPTAITAAENMTAAVTELTNKLAEVIEHSRKYNQFERTLTILAIFDILLASGLAYVLWRG